MISALLLGLAALGCGPDRLSRDGGGASDAGAAPDAENTDRPQQLGAKMPIGRPCEDHDDCDSTFCADGVCCATACTAPCHWCGSADNIGTCVPALAGTDPREDCAEAPAATCGRDGTCDGAGACRFHPPGVVCTAESCAGSSLTSAARCDGLGTCVAPASVSCLPYTCGNDNACRTNCSDSTQCVAPNSCIAGACGKRPVGDACDTADQCNSGFCEQRVCCATACTGTCQSCAVSGSAGTCTPVPNGEDPLDHCPKDDASTCARDGACDGAGACRRYAVGTECAGPSCSGSTLSAARTCDGEGTCRPATTSSCGHYVCANGSACGTRCNGDNDNGACVAPAVCLGNVCGVPAILKLEYRHLDTNTGDNEIKPNFRVLNVGGTAVPLSELKIRYWYTSEGRATDQAWCEHAVVGCQNVSGVFGTWNAPYNNATHYVELGFTSGAGNLAANGASTEINIRVQKTDFSAFNETNDYSYDVSKTTYGSWDRIGIYRGGALVWGVEPR